MYSQISIWYQLVSMFHLICESKISNWYLSQNLLKAKRRISFRGSFYLVKGKAFETGGEISNLKNAYCNIIPIPLTICKNKTSGANVVQNVK